MFLQVLTWRLLSHRPSILKLNANEVEINYIAITYKLSDGFWHNLLPWYGDIHSHCGQKEGNTQID